MVHGLPSSLADPSIEIALYGREGGKVTWQLSPLATCGDDSELSEKCTCSAGVLST